MDDSRKDFLNRKKWIEEGLRHWEPLFQEQRQNIRFDKGFHYSGNQESLARRIIENSKVLPESLKIRVTKNHMNYIGRAHRNYLLDKAPGVGIYPQDDSELKDQKTAELNRKVWSGVVRRHRLKSQINNWSYQYVVPGELAVFVNWDAAKGDFKGYEQAYDENGKVVGEPVPLFSGDFVFEVIDGYNLVLDPTARRFEDSDAAFRKLASRDMLKKRYAADPEKLRLLDDSDKDIYQTFDSTTGGFDKDTTGKVVLWYHLKRPCEEYPLGYYWVSTPLGDLEQGELPGGKWPLVYTGYEHAGDSCRCNSIFRHLKTWQRNINRLASKSIENSVVMSADKFLAQKGSQIRQAPVQPGSGAAVFEYVGMKPDFVKGSAGEQFLNQSAAEVQEMYTFAGLDLQAADKLPTDAMATLFATVNQRAKFDIHIKRFEEFLVQLSMTVLELARVYYSDEMLAEELGANEIVNIPEFRTSDPLRCRITVEPQNDDASTLMGKQLQFSQILQYGGQFLDAETVGVMARNLTFLNSEPALKKLTLNYDVTTNIILALNRGEWVDIYDEDDNAYIIPWLIARTREADFKTLHPLFQQMFREQIRLRTEAERKKQELAQFASQGLIPTSADVVRVNMSEIGPDGMPHRIWLPRESIQWLKTALEKQGLQQQMLQQMDPTTVAAFGQARMLEGASSSGAGMPGPTAQYAPVADPAAAFVS